MRARKSTGSFTDGHRAGCAILLTVNTRPAALSALVSVFLFSSAFAGSGLFADLRTTGYGWAKPDVTVSIKTLPGAEGFRDDVVSVVGEWNGILARIRGAPNLSMSETPADVSVIISPSEGPCLGFAKTSTSVRNSCVLSRVTIVLYTKALGRHYSHAGLRNISRHEFAHALGIGHSNDEKEQMFPLASTGVFFGQEDIRPSECEAKALSAIYPMKPYCVMPEKVDCF